MPDEDGNGNGDGVGNPFVGEALCYARREHIEAQISSMEGKILGSIKLSSAIVGVVISIIMLGLHFYG